MRKVQYTMKLKERENIKDNGNKIREHQSKKMEVDVSNSLEF